MATPIKTIGSHDKMVKNIVFSGVSDLLNSYDVHSDRSKYSFIAMEVLHKLFVEKIHHQELTEQIKGFVDYEK